MCFLFLLVVCFTFSFEAFGYNPEHYANFLEQYESREPVVCKGFNLDGAPLTGLSLIKADFSGSSLKGADLSDSDLSKADLRKANLSDANLARSIFNGSKLKDAVFKGANARHIRAKGTVLEDEGFLRYNNVQSVPSPIKGQKLDLHGHALKNIPGLLEDFLSRGLSHHYSILEIVTGRGIHSPDGKKGKLHRFCKQYLRENWGYYIEEIVSTSKDGAWKLLLKKQNN